MLFPSGQTAPPMLDPLVIFQNPSQISPSLCSFSWSFLLPSPTIRHNSPQPFLDLILVYAISVILHYTYLITFLLIFLDWETPEGKKCVRLIYFCNRAGHLPHGECSVKGRTMNHVLCLWLTLWCCILWPYYLAYIFNHIQAILWRFLLIRMY